MTTAVDDPRTVPGALEVHTRRELPDGGLIEFEFSPSGWTTKAGERRQRDWRAYFYTPPDGKRERMVSVTTVLDAILPKGGLPPWAEARGIEGTWEAFYRGALDLVQHTPVDAVEIVRGLRLGADRARDDAADRGLNVHALLQEYMETSTPPKLADHPVEHRGYIQGLCRWLLKANPHPLAVEELVCSPQDGYAGRTDLLAKCDGLRVRFDAKTNERGCIYESAHVQVKLYDRGAVAGGEEPSDRQAVVVFSADGEFREMDSLASDETVDAGLAWWRAIKPITSACESANRVEKAARAT